MKKADSVWAMSSALLALASSVLTDLLYGEISGTRYEGQLSGERLTLEEIGDFDFKTRLLYISFLFFVTWTVLFVIRWCLPRLVRRLQYRNKQSYTREKVYSDFILAKTILAETRRTDKLEPKNILLYSEKIGGAITLLYSTFCPHKKRLELVVKNSFRTGLICDFGQRISPYEYYAVIRVAYELLSDLSQMGAKEEAGEILRSDCARLCKQLEELKVVVP